MFPQSDITLAEKIKHAQTLPSGVRRDLQESLLRIEENVWLKACRGAVHNNNHDWLRHIATDGQGEWAIQVFNNAPFRDSQMSHVRTARSIADCALSSLLLARLAKNSSDANTISELLDSLYRAVLQWQPLGAVSAAAPTPNRETIAAMQQALIPGGTRSSKHWALLELIQREYPDWEIAPVGDLVDYFLSEGGSNWERSVEINVMLDCGDDGGLVVKLSLRKRENGFGKLYRDPLTMSFLQYHTSFQNALKNAWTYVRANGFGNESCDVTWHLVSNEVTDLLESSTEKYARVPDYVKGESIGAAFALGLQHIFDKHSPSHILKDWAVTGSVTAEGIIGSVDGYKPKLNAVASEKKLKALVPSIDYPNLKSRWAEKIETLAGASTVEEAYDIIQKEEERKRKEQQARIWKTRFRNLLVVAVIVLSIATIAAMHQWSLAKARGQELEVQKAEIERINSQLAAANQDLNGKNADLGEANGELDTKNKELDKANREVSEERDEKERQRLIAEDKKKEAEQQRQIAEAQREEAQRQRQFAETQKEEARAQRQLAVARQLELQASRALAEGDAGVARVLFAKALTFDDSHTAREGVLAAKTKAFTPLLWTTSNHLEGANPIAFSPDHQRFAWGDSEGTVHLINANDGNEIKTFVSVHSQDVTSIVFMPDGKSVITGGIDGIVRLWKIESGEDIRSLRFKESPKVTTTPDEGIDSNPIEVISVAVNSDGKYVAIGTDAGSVWLWDTHTSDVVQISSEQRGHIISVAFNSKDYLAASGWDQTVHVWNISNPKKPVTVLRLPLQNPILSVAFSLDGQQLALAGGSELLLWNLKTGSKIELSGHQRAVNSVAYSPDGQHIASGGEDGTVRLWDITTGKAVSIVGNGLGLVWRVAFSSDGRLACSALDQPIRCWNSMPGTDSPVFTGHQGTITSVTFSPDGRRLASGSLDNTVRVWDVEKRKEISTLREHDDPVMNLAFSSDGRWIFMGGLDEKVQLWDAETGKKGMALSGHEDVVLSVAFSTDGHYLISGGADNTVRLWDLKTNKEVYSLRGHEDVVRCVAFSPDGHTIISGSEDGTIRLWDFATGQQVKVLDAHDALITSISFSPNGKYFASAGLDQRVRLWNTEARKAYQVFFSPEGQSISVTFSSNGRYLLWADGPVRKIRIVEVESGREMPSLQASGGALLSVAVSSDGRWVASGGQASTVNLWDFQAIEHLYYSSPDVVLDEALYYTGLQIDAPEIFRFSQTELNQILNFNRDVSFNVVPKRINDRRLPPTNKSVRRSSTDRAALKHECPNVPITATLNPFPLTFSSPAAFCSNYPPIDLRLVNRGSYSRSEEDWNNGINVKAGDELYVLMYVDNGAANNLPAAQVVARNIRVKTFIDTAVGSNHTVSVSFAGENTNTVSKSLPIQTGPNDYLQIVPNSGEIFDYAARLMENNLQIGNNTISIGDLTPGFTTDLFIRFKVRVASRRR